MDDQYHVVPTSTAHPPSKTEGGGWQRTYRATDHRATIGRWTRTFTWSSAS